MPFNISTEHYGPVRFRSRSCMWAPGPLGDYIRVQSLLPICQCRSTVDGWVVTVASYSSNSTPLHLALSTAPTPCLPLEWPVSVAATARNVQAFIAADIRASRLVFITTAVVPCTLTIPGHSFYCPGTCLLVLKLNLLTSQTGPIVTNWKSTRLKRKKSFSIDLACPRKYFPSPWWGLNKLTVLKS